MNSQEMNNPAMAGDAELQGIAPEAEASEAPEGAWQKKISQLEDEVTTLRDGLLRTVADLENARKQGTRELENARKFAITAFARDLLPVADNLTRAVSCFSSTVEDSTTKTVMEGIGFVQRELEQLFARHRIQSVGKIGEKFDPHLHQAMAEAESEGEPGRIMQILQEGYTLSERLLRPALVTVSKRKSLSPEEQTEG